MFIGLLSSLPYFSLLFFLPSFRFSFHLFLCVYVCVWISHHALQPHLFPHSFLSVFSPCNLPSKIKLSKNNLIMEAAVCHSILWYIHLYLQMFIIVYHWSASMPLAFTTLSIWVLGCCPVSWICFFGSAGASPLCNPASSSKMGWMLGLADACIALDLDLGGG